MNIEYLVTMANQIGSFFETGPDRTEAARNIASHLRRYWEPRMRKQIIAHVKAGGAGLSPAASMAVELLAQEPAPAVEVPAAVGKPA